MVMAVTNGVLVLRGCGVTRISRFEVNSMVVLMGHRARGDTQIMPHLLRVPFVGNFIRERHVIWANGACFECEEVGHLAKDCKKGSTSSRGNKNNKPQATSGRVFALTTEHAVFIDDILVYSTTREEHEDHL
nr:hypothetical protein [Tanacetum cinerariifolium]